MYKSQRSISPAMLLLHSKYVQIVSIRRSLIFLFQDLLTKHKSLCADFLERNYDQFFNRYRDLLNSENYVTRRQSLKVSESMASAYLGQSM